MRQRPERADDVLGFFNRHLVPIYLEVQLAGKVAPRVWTAFVFSVHNRWMLMTAGHCITEVERERAGGAKVLNCKLLDGLNSQAAHADPIPFEYDDFRPTMLGTHADIDYGALFPTSNARALLEKNNVKPFTEASWDHEISEFTMYKFLGVPSELTRHVGDGRWNITTLFQRVRRLKRRPPNSKRIAAPMFYGRIMGDPEVKLRGMSGGPIMGFRQEGGRERYHLVGMQVGVLRGKYIYGMQMRPLGKVIQKIVAKRAVKG